MRLKSHHYDNTVFSCFEMVVLIILNQIEIKNILATSCLLNNSALYKLKTFHTVDTA